MAREIAAALAAKGIAAVDSPVSGGVAGAIQGTLAVMVACPRAMFGDLEPMLKHIGRVFFVGERPGMGQTMKLANNLLSATALAATSEAIVLGVKSGLDAATMIDVINAGSGRNSASQDKFPKAILPRTFDFGFTTGLMDKDLKLCLEEAEVAGCRCRWRRRSPSSGTGAQGDRRGSRLHDDRAARRAVGGRRGQGEALNGEMSDGGARALRDLRDQVRRPPAARERELHRRRPARRADAARLLRVGSQERGADVDRRHRLRRRDRAAAPAQRDPLAGRGTEGARHRARRDRGRHHHPHALRPLRQPRPVRARFHVQDEEMRYATGRSMCHPMLRHAFDVEDVVRMVRRAYGGRVAFHDGDEELAPGISVHFVGGHTMGLQMVRVWTKRGWVVLASDASHLYANMEQERPFPIVYDVADMLAGHERAYALAASRRHVIPGHDPLVLKRYPAPSRALEGMVARLDVDPVGD